MVDLRRCPCSFLQGKANFLEATVYIHEMNMIQSTKEKTFQKIALFFRPTENNVKKSDKRNELEV